MYSTVRSVLSSPCRRLYAGRQINAIPRRDVSPLLTIFGAGLATIGGTGVAFRIASLPTSNAAGRPCPMRRK